MNEPRGMNTHRGRGGVWTGVYNVVQMSIGRHSRKRGTNKHKWVIQTNSHMWEGMNVHGGYE